MEVSKVDFTIEIPVINLLLVLYIFLIRTLHFSQFTTFIPYSLFFSNASFTNPVNTSWLIKPNAS